MKKSNEKIIKKENVEYTVSFCFGSKEIENLLLEAESYEGTIDEWIEEKEALEKKAKADGTWNKVGLDSNNHLFKEVDKKAKEKLDKIKSMIDEQ